MVAAGTLQYEVELLRQVQIGTNDLNEPEHDYVPVFSFWAAKVNSRGSENFGSDQRFAQRSVTFRTHYLTDLEMTDQLRCEGIVFDIKDIREIPFRRGTEIEALAKVRGATA